MSLYEEIRDTFLDGVEEGMRREATDHKAETVLRTVCMLGLAVAGAIGTAAIFTWSLHP